MAKTKKPYMVPSGGGGKQNTPPARSTDLPPEPEPQPVEPEPEPEEDASATTH